MKLTAKQLAKLTPAQRKARAKRLAYNHKYDARKKLERMKGKKFVKVRDRSPASVEKRLARIRVLMKELLATKQKEKAIIDELATMHTF